MNTKNNKNGRGGKINVDGWKVKNQNGSTSIRETKS